MVWGAAALAGAVALTVAGSFVDATDHRPRPAQTVAAGEGSATSTVPPPRAPSTRAPRRRVRLVAWHGPVEHLFFHTLVLHPELAFEPDWLGRGFRDWFVTAGEFRRILEQLDANGWTLVDLHRAVAGTVRVPPGRKPFVLSVDDVNYYDYSRPRGVGWKLALDAHGDVKVEDHFGGRVRLRDDDVVPMVDEFVAAHPEFSADGAKGVLTVTGYEGVLGERTNERAAPDWPARVARAKALVRRLRATGWTFASHSWGHLDFEVKPLATRGRADRRPDRRARVSVRRSAAADVADHHGAAPLRLHDPVRHRHRAADVARRRRDDHRAAPRRRRRVRPAGPVAAAVLRRRARRGPRRSRARRPRDFDVTRRRAGRHPAQSVAGARKVPSFEYQPLTPHDGDWS